MDYSEYLHQAHSHQFYDSSMNHGTRVFTLMGILEVTHPKIPHGAQAVPSATKDHAPTLQGTSDFSPCPTLMEGMTGRAKGQATERGDTAMATGIHLRPVEPQRRP